jgi:hypothetical protein
MTTRLTHPLQQTMQLTPQEIGTPQSFTSPSHSLRRSCLCCASFPFLVFVVLISSFDILHAAPPPELTVLRQQYDKVVAERVTAPFDAGLAELNTKYTAGLDRFIGEAKTAGELKTVLALEAEKKRLADQQPMPAEDDDQTPESLKKLRVIYREQFKKLEEARTANHAALLPAYTAKLAALEVTLTKADRVAEAAEVLTYREALAVGAPATPAVASAPPAGATPTPPPAPAAESAKLPKGDDRKAAEWVLGYVAPGSATYVQVQAGNTIFKCVKPADLPPGKFQVTYFDIDGFRAPMPRLMPNEDTMVLAGLTALKRFQINRAGITDEGLRFMATCPQLSSVSLHSLNLTGEVFQHLAQARALTSLDFTGVYSKMNWAGLGLLAGFAISELTLRVETLPDEAMPHLAGLKQLITLDLRGAAITDAGIAPLAGLTKLTSLNLSLTHVTPQGLLKLRGLKLKELSFGRKDTWLELAAPQLPAIAAAFPDVEETELPRAGSYTAASIEPLCTAFPKLRVLRADDVILEPGAVQALTHFTKLEELALGGSTANDGDLATLVGMKNLRTLVLGGTQITDGGLELLAKMKSLKALTLPKPGKGVTADGIAKFKKQRPDIAVK